MFTQFGGRTVEKGTYWNLTSGARIDVDGTVTLKGSRADRYVKIPVAGLCIAGPLAGLLFTVVIPFLFLLVMLALLPRTVHASGASLGDEAQVCLDCHATPGMTMTFTDKSTASVHVDGSHFRNSVHRDLSCTNCHSDVSLDSHPAAKYASKQQFLLHLASACRTCHADEQVLANPLHQRAITRANAPPCSECHGSHAIRKVPTKHAKQNTTQYCLTCHQHQLSTTINGHTLSLTIDEGRLRGSVHSDHTCTDCHITFSREDHPDRRFSSVREVSIAGSEACRRCHIDKAEQHKGSVHFSLLSAGDQRAPVCSDCHGAHAVGRKGLADTLAGVPCKNCHQEVFSLYEGSVHGKARKDGKGAAPLCSNCHFAHDVKPTMASRSPKDMCLGCHAGIASAHEAWLPNTGAHFDAVACTACHVPEGFQRSVYVRVTDDSSGLLVSDTVVRNLLRSSRTAMHAVQGKHIDADEVWSLYKQLKSEYAVRMSGTVGLTDRRNAHLLAPKTAAVRQCEFCHSANTAFFRSVSMAVGKDDGRESLIDVDKSAIGSLYAMVPLNQFYILGASRIAAMDYLGAAMVLGGMAVPFAHGTLRMLTARHRRERREKQEREARRGGAGR